MTIDEGFRWESIQISIVRDAEGLKLLRDRRLSVAGVDIGALITTASELGEGSPLELETQVSLDLTELTRDEKREIVKALSPSIDVWGLLGDYQDTPDDFDGMPYDVPVVETGVSIDGRTWGWFPYWEGPTGSIFPVGRKEMLSVIKEFHGASMTSGTTFIGISCVGDVAALSYQWDTESEVYQIDYEVDDWRPLISRAFASGPPMCPACDVAKDWNISFETSLPVSAEVLGEELKWLWQPCAEHEGLGERLTIAANSGYEWCWGGHDWVPNLAMPL